MDTNELHQRGLKLRVEMFGADAVEKRMNEGGVIFADGIEQDHLNFDWGRTTDVSIAKQQLNLVLPS